MRALASSLVLSSFVLAIVGCSGTDATQTAPTDGGAHEQPDGSTSDSGTTGGGDAGDAGDSGTQGAPSGCVPACSGDTICVKKQLNGGAAHLVDDAGACPPGSHAQGNFCAADPVYDCETRPASCGASFDCSCTSTICTGGYQCEGTTPNEIDCVLNAP